MWMNLCDRPITDATTGIVVVKDLYHIGA